MTLQAPPRPVAEPTERRPPPPWSHAPKVARNARDRLPLPLPPSPRRHHPWRRALLAIAVVVALLLAGGVVYVWWPRPATPITEDEALEEFRQVGGSGGAAAAGALPPGVYVYAADGAEDVAIAGIPLPTRDIPDAVTVMVVPEGSCQRVTLNLMAEHTETSLYCRDGDGNLVLVEQTKQEIVAGVTTDGLTTCDPGVLGRPGDGPRPVRCSLLLTAAGTEIAVGLDGTARWEPGGVVVVGTEARATDRLVLDLAASGDMTGHMRERQAVDSVTGLPLVIERDILLDGPGRFAEQTVLTLGDLAAHR
jgi:hypothetical protein